VSGGGGDRRPRRFEARRPGRAGAGGAQSRKPEPVSRHPHTVTWDPHPEIESREKEKVLATAEYQTGARVLARMGLSLDIGVCFPQLPELAAFAKAVPNLTIILNHLGGLTRIGPYANRDDEVLATWRRGIAALADCRNVNLKLGGVGMPRMGFDWHTRTTPIGSEELAASTAPLMSYCIEQLGPDRCMFELPGRQGVVLAPRAVQDLQAVLEGLFGGRPRRGVAPQGAAAAGREESVCRWSLVGDSGSDLV
jgi:hypothetical protein